MQIYNGDNRIALEVVQPACKAVHGHPLTKEEVKLEVKKLYVEELSHPEYNYDIEVGSYIAWRLADIEVCKKKKNK